MKGIVTSVHARYACILIVGKEDHFAIHVPRKNLNVGDKVDVQIVKTASGTWHEAKLCEDDNEQE
jgi:hypothetical protein